MSRTLTRAGLHRRIIETTDTSSAEAERLLTRLLELLGETLAGGETVKMTGFGTLEVRTRGARQGRNPKTGQAYPVAARRVVVFTPSAQLRGKLDALRHNDIEVGNEDPARRVDIDA